MKNTTKYNQLIAITLAVLVHIFLCFLLLKSAVQNQPKVSLVTLDISVIETKAENHHEKKLPKVIAKNSAVLPDNSQNIHHHQSTVQDSQVSSDAKTTPQYNPLPRIPDDLRAEAFQSEAVARFYIDQFGNVEKVELIKPCGNPRLNSLLLKTLRQWKFSSSKQASTQDIKVKFSVQ